MTDAISRFLNYRTSYYYRRKYRKYLNLPTKYKPKREKTIYNAFYPSKDEDFLNNIDIRTIIENCDSKKHDIYIKEYCDLSKRFKQPINWINSMNSHAMIAETDNYNRKLRLRMMKIIFRSINDENIKTKNEIIIQIAYLEMVKQVFKDTEIIMKQQQLKQNV